MKQTIVRIAAILFVIAAITGIRLSPAGHLLSFENLKREQAVLLGWVQHHEALAAAAFVLLYIAVTALSLPGAAIMTLAGGSLFGVLPATIYATAAATTGGVLAFLAARYFLGNWIQARYDSQLNSFNREVRKNGARYLLGLRLIPVFPFFLINLLAGLTPLSPSTFLWTTAVGIVPGTVLYAYAGSELSRISSPADILSPRMALVLGALGLIAVMPAILDRVRAARKKDG